MGSTTKAALTRICAQNVRILTTASVAVDTNAMKDLWMKVGSFVYD